MGLAASGCTLPPIFLEIFSGKGVLSQAARKAGWIAIEIDIAHGFDVLIPKFKKILLGFIRSKLVTAVHLGVPCSSWSRARDRPNGPPRLRSDLEVWGLPALAPHDQKKVDTGNALARLCFRLAAVAMQHGVAGSIENPATSRLWIIPPARRLQTHSRVQSVSVDFCLFGTPWRKRTIILGWDLGLQELACRCSSLKGICDRSKVPHQTLQGKDPSGKFWTSIAEPYPPRFADKLFRVFVHWHATRQVAYLARLTC